MNNVVLSNATVITMNPKREILRNGAVAVVGNSIAAVGRIDEISRDYPDAEIVDAAGMLLIPGLIDGHNHPNHYLSNGIGDDVDIMTWAYKRIYPYEAALSEEEAYIGALGAFIEGIQYGTTCFNDPGGYHADAVVRAAIDSGIRGIVNRSTRDLSHPDTPIPGGLIESTETCLREADAFVRRWNGAADGRIQAWCSLRYVFNISDELAVGIGNLANELNVGIHAHAAAVVGENEAIYARFGKRSLERYYDLGIFGPNLYLVHVGFPNEREIAWMQEANCKVAHCPTASMLGAYGVIHNRMIPTMSEAGIKISLGTDSATAGGHLDMIRVMYAGACAHKDAAADATVMGARKALEMATIEGAQACLLENSIGSIEVGKRADLVLIDTSGIEWHTGREPVENLVYSATGQNVDTVMIDGQIVMRNRQFLHIDVEELKRSLGAATQAWRKRTGVKVPSAWPMLN